MPLTQMFKQYLAIKEKHNDCMLFYRLGDFYEMFFEDAVTGSEILGLALTGRECGLEKRAPMCGIPFHSAAGYIKKLVDKGYKVAICEQLERPQKGKLLVDRDVIKVITAGTISDDNSLDENKNNYIAAVYYDTGADGKKANCAISWCDVTTGQFYATETDKCEEMLGLISPAEVVRSSDEHYTYAFAASNAHNAILKYLGITDVSIFDFSKSSLITKSSGALLEYLLLTQKKVMANISRIQVIRNNEFMMLDKAARENLELTRQYREKSKRGSLLWVIDDTKTSMGARELVRWLERPLQDIQKINDRLDAVEELIGADNSTELAAVLSKIFDIQRLSGKVARGDIMPRDLLGLAKSLESAAELKRRTAGFKASQLRAAHDNLKELTHLTELIRSAIAEAPPAALSDGGYIRDGYNKKLDEYRAAGGLGRSWIAKLEAKERIECQLKELKIGFNRISGYYFEVPLRLSNKVPYRFTRRATTASTERFITAELKGIEEKISGAATHAIELEAKLYAEIKNTAAQSLADILGDAEAVTAFDALLSLANAAAANKWVRPEITGRSEFGGINLKDARHPSVEKLIGANKFIANDFSLGGRDDKKNPEAKAATTMILTGPNMAGKSTYMRTVALTVLLAHIGSFVPCTSASVALTDRIFTRIGASDSMLTGQSTFMVETNELGQITNLASRNSLVLLDELGRGTGTQEGRALASAAITYITDKIGCNTMFATHFHELADLADTNPRIKSYKAVTQVIDGEIVFLHKIEPGREEHSFALEVARMAGIPKEILDNAKKLYNKMN